jgi:hypothetical protein
VKRKPTSLKRKKQYKRMLSDGRKGHRRRHGSAGRWSAMAYGVEIQEQLDAAKPGETVHLRGGWALLKRPLRSRNPVDGHGFTSQQ